jgi:3-dehydroquinate synthetase
VEGTIGERLGVTAPGTTDALREVIERAGLPSGIPAEYAPARVVEATRSDKKARQGRVEYSLIERIGTASAGPDGRWAWGVEDALVVEALEASRR